MSIGVVRVDTEVDKSICSKGRGFVIHAGRRVEH